MHKQFVFFPWIIDMGEQVFNGVDAHCLFVFPLYHGLQREYIPAGFFYDMLLEFYQLHLEFIQRPVVFLFFHGYHLDMNLV